MKRVVTALLFVIIAGSALAEQTHRYVVAMKPERAGARAAKGGEFAGRDFQDLRNLDSFIANLTDSEVVALRKDPNVRYVESGEILYFASSITPQRNATSEGHPVDAQVTPPGITLLDAPSVWPVTRGDGINVAVVDTGIDYKHPELKDIYQGGFNVKAKTNDPMDDDGHGTHVSGTIAAADNGVGVVGVAPKVKLWGVKVLNPTSSGQASGSNSDIAAGINWVIGKKTELGGNWIINMSLGQCTDPQVSDQCATTPSISLKDACQKAADAGILIFAASGNDSTVDHAATVGFPAAFSSVIAVGAIDATTQKIASFSNQGPELAVSAPGVNVFSTFIVGAGNNAFVSTGSIFDDGGNLVGSARGTVSNKFVYCGFGGTAADFPSSVKGNIALIQRGSGITFNLKTKNALTAGATAVVIFNCSKTANPVECTSDTSHTSWTLISKLADGVTDSPADLAFAWPVTVGISNADGVALRALSSTPTITVANLADDYAFESGTSMACPHAVGVAALVWGAAPNATATDVRQAMTSTATDLGSTGKDNTFGFGLLNALQAAKSIAPSKFGSGATPTPVPVPGRRITRRGR